MRVCLASRLSATRWRQLKSRSPFLHIHFWCGYGSVVFMCQRRRLLMEALACPVGGNVDTTRAEQYDNNDEGKTLVKLVDQTELSAAFSIAKQDVNKKDDASENNRNDDSMVLPRKEAWIQVIEPATSLSSSIFEFVALQPLDDSLDAVTTSPNTITHIQQAVENSAEAPVNAFAIKSRSKKRVRFVPEVLEEANHLAQEHVILIDTSMNQEELQSVEQSRQVERSYVVPDELPWFGWWDFFQLGFSLTYTAICLRRNISPRCLVFDEQLNQRQTPLTATQVAVLAYSGLAFNCSTEALVIRQAQPPTRAPSPLKSKKRRKRRTRRLHFAVAMARRKGMGLSKWVAQLSQRLVPATKADSGVEPTHTVKPKPQLRFKASLKLKLSHRPAAKSDPSAMNPQKAKAPGKKKIGSRGAIAVFQALRVNVTLVSLCLEYASIDDSAMSALAAALRVNANLTQLSLVGNRIGPGGARDLADALENCPDSMLLDLNLRDNRLGAQGAQELGRALRENETLTCCDVSWNQIGPQAVLGLLSALRDNFVLRELCVYGRDLAADGSQYLANLDYDSAQRIVVALRHVNESFAVTRLSGIRAILPIDKIKSSRWVLLSGREFTELDGLVIAGLIPRNTMLLSLDLHDNPGLGRTAVLELLMAIKCLPTLRDVNLSNVGLFGDAGENVGEIVSLNRTLLNITMHKTTLPVQQIRGNERAGEVLETMTFSVASEHFLDRWILAKCFAVNRLTQELNGLRIAAAASTLKAAAIGVTASQKDLKDLVTINLSGRDLELHEVAFLGKKMLHHLQLGRVALNSCGLDGAAARALADGVRNHSSIHTLELENNPLGPIGGQALAECLASSNALTYLNLSWAQLGDDGVITFREALARNKSIERLDLRGNDLRVRGVVAIAEGLRRTATLRELHLRWNTVSPAGAEALAVALEINQSIRLLDIEHHTMGSRGAAAFAAMLERNKHLEHLNVSGTDSDDSLEAGSGISSKQATRIAQALTHTNRSLRVLHIGANRIDAEAAAQFGEVLKLNKVLATLDLSWSGLDAKAAPRFFACLSVNSSLLHLNVAHNRIGNEGLVACIRALETNKTLRELNLGYNALTEEPLALLASKLRAPKRTITSSLEWLCLTGNVMTERTRKLYQSLPASVIAVELTDKQNEQDDD